MRGGYTGKLNPKLDAELPDDLNFQFPTVKLGGIADGTSNVFMVSEKSVKPSLYYTPDYNDLSFCVGRNTRCTFTPPMSDVARETSTAPLGFGSAHASGINALLVDGSVQHYSFRIPKSVFELLARRADGNAIEASGW